MTRKSTWNRLAVVARAIDNQPLALPAIDRAYATFLRTGELGDDHRLAGVVLQRALHARRESADLDTGAWADGQQPATSLKASPRGRVFGEAACASDPARVAARALIHILVRNGYDPTDPEFIPSDLVEPEFGGVAMHALGWPDRWVRPQYAHQMQRVLQQHAKLRKHVVRSEAWYRDAAAGLRSFLTHGEVPSEPDVRLFALTMAEMFALNRHYFTGTNEDLLAAFDAVARAVGAKRDAALVHLAAVQARCQEGK